MFAVIHNHIIHDNIKAIQELPLPHDPTLKQANEFIGGIG
ncbi:unnamed protein product, partial [Didymodactylos carnosus]